MEVLHGVSSYPCSPPHMLTAWERNTMSAFHSRPGLLLLLDLLPLHPKPS